MRFAQRNLLLQPMFFSAALYACDSESEGENLSEPSCEELMQSYEAELSELDENCSIEEVCGVMTGCESDDECVIVPGSGVDTGSNAPVYGFPYGVPMAASEEISAVFAPLFSAMRAQACESGMVVDDTPLESGFSARCDAGRCVAEPPPCTRCK
jgi:hypothetical protein